MAGNTKSSFYGDTPNYATSFPTKNDSNTAPVTGNTKAPTGFYRNGTQYATLANSDTLTAEFDADLAAAQAAATAAQNSANAAAASLAAMTPATALPLMDATPAVVGVGTRYAREDHVHPTDSTRAALSYVNATFAPLASPALTGTPTAPTAAALTNTTQIATTAYADAAVGVEKTRALAAEALLAPLASPALTGTPTVPTAAVDTNTTQAASTAFVLGQASAVADGTPAMDGTAARGTSTHFARADHVHPTDTSLAPLASPALTGTPTAPTAAANTNNTQIATTAYVDTAQGLDMKLAGNQTVTGGFNLTPFNHTAGSFTVNPLSGNYQYINNSAAYTITAPTSDCAVDLLVTNVTGAGATTFSGFTVGANTGDALTTTVGSKFIISIRRINAISTYTIKALQ